MASGECEWGEIEEGSLLRETLGQYLLCGKIEIKTNLLHCTFIMGREMLNLRVTNGDCLQFKSADSLHDMFEMFFFLYFPELDMHCFEQNGLK